MYHVNQSTLKMAEAGSPVLLRLRGVSKTLASVHVLDGVNLEVCQGEFLSVLGPSGCGKTTLLRLIAGFAAADAGTMTLGSERIDTLPAARRPINTVFQNYSLFPHLSVAENVAFGLEMLRRPRAEIANRVGEMLELVQLADMGQRPIHDLSGGQQQRVALARALAPAPRLLLLDEPLSALDRHLRQRMQDELRRLQRRSGTSFIFVTHDQEEALALSDRIAVMNGGRIEQIDTPENIYFSPASRFVAGFVGNSNLIPGAVADGVFQSADGGLRLQGAEPGANVLVVKPEDFEPAAEGLRVEVVSASFGGASAIVTGRLAGGQELVLSLREKTPRVGELLFIAPRRWHFLAVRS